MAESSIAALPQTEFFESIFLLLVVSKIYPSKGCRISSFSLILRRSAESLTWQGSERLLCRILLICVPKRSIPFLFYCGAPPPSPKHSRTRTTPRRSAFTESKLKCDLGFGMDFANDSIETWATMNTQTVPISHLFEFSKCAFRERDIGRLMTCKFDNCDLQIAETWSCHLIFKQVLKD